MKRPGLVVALGAAGALGLLALAAASEPGRRVEKMIEGYAGRFFTWAELTASSAARRLGLDNTPPPEARAALRDLVANVLDPLRAALGRPVQVNSAYRAPAVNAAVKGHSNTSQHMRGEAADIAVPGLSAEHLAAFIVAHRIPFDQLIFYHPSRGGHVHISFTRRYPLRHQTLYAPASGGYVAMAPPPLPPGVA